MAAKRSGSYQVQGDYKAFIPTNIPPVPPIEITGKKRAKRYAFQHYIALLSEGTDADV